MDNGKYWALLDKTAVGPANNPKISINNDATLSNYYFGDFLHSSIFTVLPN